MLKLPNEWSNALQDETEKDYFKELCTFVEDEYNSNVIYPPKEDVFNVLKYTSLEDVKVVILGQVLCR